MAVLIALLLCSVLVSGVAAQPKWNYYFPAITCPQSPNTLCDFYFDGHQNDIPTFYLEDNLIGDHALVPVSRSVLSLFGDSWHFSPGVKENRGDAFVLANSGNATFLKYPEGTYDEQGALLTFDQFYTNALTDTISRLWARSWHTQSEFQNGIGYFMDKCVFLPFNAVFIPKTSLNLNVDDHNSDYPEDRRCIVFKTAKAGAQRR